MAMSKELQAEARSLSYHQRKALKQVGKADASDEYSVGPRSLQQLIDAGLATRHLNGTLTLALTDSGRRLHDALAELGWFPPG